LVAVVGLLAEVTVDTDMKAMVDSAAEAASTVGLEI